MLTIITSMCDPQTIRQKNKLLELAGVEWLSFRLPNLRVEPYFHYKLVDSGPFSVSTHRHEHWEVTRVSKGRAVYTVDHAGKEVDVIPDRDGFLVIPPGKTHRWVLKDAPLLLNGWQIRIIPEDDEGENLLRDMTKVFEERAFFFDAGVLTLQAEAMLLPMTEGVYPPGLLGPMVSGVGRIIVAALVSSVRDWSAFAVEHGEDAVPGSQVLANKLREFIEANLGRPITLVDLESHFHYSSRHLNRIFHQHFHSSIGQYLRDRRFELATRWLVTTNRSIKDIALSLGYTNTSHFCYCFRKRKMLSPSEYREKGMRREVADFLYPGLETDKESRN